MAQERGLSCCYMSHMFDDTVDGLDISHLERLGGDPENQFESSGINWCWPLGGTLPNGTQ